MKVSERIKLVEGKPEVNRNMKGMLVLFLLVILVMIFPKACVYFPDVSHQHFNQTRLTSSKKAPGFCTECNFEHIV